MELVAKTTAMVDRKNTIAKFRRVGIMIRSQGIGYVFRYVRNAIRGAIVTKMLPVFSNAFYKRETGSG